MADANVAQWLKIAVSTLLTFYRSPRKTTLRYWVELCTSFFRVATPIAPPSAPAVLTQNAHVSPKVRI